MESAYLSIFVTLHHVDWNNTYFNYRMISIKTMAGVTTVTVAVFFFLLLDLLYVDQGNISHILYFKIFKSQCVRLSATFSIDFKETSFYIKIFFIQAKAILIDWGLEGSPHLLFISKYFKIMQRIMGETIVFTEYAAICKTKLIFYFFIKSIHFY